MAHRWNSSNEAARLVAHVLVERARRLLLSALLSSPARLQLGRRIVEIVLLRLQERASGGVEGPVKAEYRLRHLMLGCLADAAARKPRRGRAVNIKRVQARR